MRKAGFAGGFFGGRGQWLGGIAGRIWLPRRLSRLCLGRQNGRFTFQSRGGNEWSATEPEKACPSIVCTRQPVGCETTVTAPAERV